MQIRWDSVAARDLEHIFDYLHERNPSAVLRVLKAIRLMAGGLRTMPERGRIGLVEGTRELNHPRWPYILVYLVRPDYVAIVRVRHAAQDYPGVPGAP